MGPGEPAGYEGPGKSTDSGIDRRTRSGGPFVKITKVTYNNRRKSFAVKTRRGEYEYPYARLDQPMDDLVREAYIDRELGGEAFTYVLESGSEGALDYNSDPMYIADLVP